MKGSFLLNSDEIILGRDPVCQIVLGLPPISRRHAAIRRSAQGYSLCDLGSANGTTLNGSPVGEKATPLHPGDVLVLAGAVRLHVEQAPGEPPSLILDGGVWIDAASREVYVDGNLVEPALSPAQFTLLNALYQAAGRLLSRGEIVSAVWPGVDPAGVSDEAVDGLVKRLRQRLRSAEGGDLLQSVRGRGLRLTHY
ncbi:FHA domain-containing protein [Longilinea arvoryzae]|nr:FHA domain-containing protein [Longilinea arvoryzae]